LRRALSSVGRLVRGLIATTLIAALVLAISLIALYSYGQSLDERSETRARRQAEAALDYIQLSRTYTAEAISTMGLSQHTSDDEANDDCLERTLLAASTMTGSAWQGREPTRARVGRAGQVERVLAILAEQGVDMSVYQEERLRRGHAQRAARLTELMPGQKRERQSALQRYALRVYRAVSERGEHEYQPLERPQQDFANRFARDSDARARAHRRMLTAERREAVRVARGLAANIRDLDSLPELCEPEWSRERAEEAEREIRERSLADLAFALPSDQPS
jgi:hypothetical protein